MNFKKPLLINARFLSQKISGVQRFGIEISKILKRAYPDSIFLSPEESISQEFTEEFQPVKLGYFKGHLWEQLDLPLYVIKNHPGSILLNFCNTAPLLLKNQFVTVHDVSFEVNKKWHSFAFGSWYRFMVPIISRKSIGIFTVSQFSKSEIIKFYKIKDPSKIHVISNATASIFKKEGIVKKDNYILSVASIDPRKNLDRLLDAFKIVNKLFPDLKLILVGNIHRAFNSEGKEVIDSFESNVIFKGYLSDSEIAELYQKARLFVYISLYEGFGIPPLEAMSSGCPVLISDIACLKEVFGPTANYCDHLDQEDIARNIIALLNTNSSQGNIDALKTFASRYSWEASATAISSTIDRYIQR